MSNIIECKKLLKRYLVARIPFISINTVETGRALDLLEELGEELNNSIYVHSLTKGMYELSSGKKINDDKSIYGAVDYITDQLRHRTGLTFVFTDIPDVSDENDNSKQMLALVNLAVDTGSIIIVLNHNPIWSNLQRLGMTIKLGLPDEDELFEIIKSIISDNYSIMETCEWDENDIREAAATLNGATRIEAENVILALLGSKKLLKSDMDEVRRAKDRLFTDISGLEKIDVDESVKDVGGLAGLRKWLDEKKELMTPEKKAELRAKGLQPPRGILLVGVPGCGKSLSAKSISANWKLPLYRLDFATVQGMYVGQSENQLKNALATAESVAPCILWIDEIEKGLSGAGPNAGDGGVSTRMVGQFLFWLQECKKPVFVVATANDVSMLPSELLRRGRFDELFFVDLPTAEERREILSLYFRRYLSLNFGGPFADKIVEMTDGFTGADIESTVRDLAYRVIANSNFSLTEASIFTAFNNVVPLSQTSPERIEAIRDWGRERAVPASGRPIGDEKLSRKEGTRTRRVLV